MIETRFKDTEIGMIPENWEVKKLGDIGDVSMCKRVMKYQTTEKGDIPFYKIGTFGNKADAYITRELFDDLKQKYSYPQKGAILLSAAGTIGRTVVFDGNDSYFQDSNIVWIDNDESSVLNSYLYYCYKTMKWETENGGIVTRLYNDNLKSALLLVPNIQEQAVIASALSDVDVLLRELGELIAKKKAIKMGMMQELLTVEAVPGKEGAFRPKRRLEGFEGDWVEKRLGEVASLFNGYGFKSDTYSKIGKYKIVTIGNVQNGCLSMDDYNCITKVPDDIRDYQILKLGDILVSMTGNVGRVCRVDVTDCLLNQRVGLLKVDSNGINDDFFFTLLNSNTFESSMIEKGHGAAQPNIGKGEIEGYSFFIPISIAEQTAIAEVLSDMDAEIAALEAKRAKYEQVKNGMMQELLTGRIRLV